MKAKLTRFLPNGALDTTFGNDGALSDVFVDAKMSTAYATALLGDGAILVSGGILTESNEEKTCFVKLDPAGKHVPSFGTAGGVCATASMSMQIRQMVVGADGSLFAAGTSSDVDQDMSVLKVTQDGALDTSFGTGGRVTFTSPGDQEAVGIAFDSKGRLVVGGNCTVDQAACAWRLDTDGKVDATYGGGLATGIVGMLGMQANGMVLGPKDEIYIAGATSSSQMAIVAFDAEGNSLSTFASGGWLTFGLNTKDMLFAGAWDDGKLLLAGVGPDGTDAEGAEPQALAVRVGADGQMRNGRFPRGRSRPSCTRAPRRREQQMIEGVPFAVVLYVKRPKEAVNCVRAASRAGTAFDFLLAQDRRIQLSSVHLHASSTKWMAYACLERAERFAQLQ